MTAMMPAKGIPKERFDHIRTNQTSEALRQTIHREDRTRHEWQNKWRSDWKTQYGHTKLWGFDDYDPNHFDGEPLNRDRRNNERASFARSSRDAPVVGVHRDFSSGASSIGPSSTTRSANLLIEEESIHLPAPPPPTQTIERKVVRQVTVPVVRRVRVPVSTFGAPPNQPDGWRVDELRGHKIVEVEEVQRWAMQPQPIGKPTVVSQRDLATVDDSRRVGVQIFPRDDDRVRGIAEDVSIRDRPTVSRIESSSYERRPSSSHVSRRPSSSNRQSSDGRSSQIRSSSQRPSSAHGRSASPQVTRPSSSNGGRLSSSGKRAPSPSIEIGRGSSNSNNNTNQTSNSNNSNIDRRLSSGNRPVSGTRPRSSSSSSSNTNKLVPSRLSASASASVRGVSKTDLIAVANGESRPQIYTHSRPRTPSSAPPGSAGSKRGWR